MYPNQAPPLADLDEYVGLFMQFPHEHGEAAIEDVSRTHAWFPSRATLYQSLMQRAPADAGVLADIMDGIKSYSYKQADIYRDVPWYEYVRRHQELCRIVLEEVSTADEQAVWGLRMRACQTLLREAKVPVS